MIEFAGAVGSQLASPLGKAVEVDSSLHLYLLMPDHLLNEHF